MQKRTAPVSPVGQRFFVDTEYATGVAALIVGFGALTIYFQDERYGTKSFASGLLALSELISGNEEISLGQIENAIHALRPDDHFYLTPDVNLVTSSDDAVFAL